MFNHDRKLQFINAYTSKTHVVAVIEKLFERLAKYEEQWQIDVAEFSSEQLQESVSKISGSRIHSVESVMTVIRAYLGWCYDAGLPTSSAIHTLRIRTENRVRNRMVSSPTHLLEELNKRFYSTEKGTVDIVYRALLWLAFIGLDDRDAVRLTAKNIDLKHRNIRFLGDRYVVYPEAIPDLEQACTLDSFRYETTMYTQQRQRKQGKSILRGIGEGADAPDLQFLRKCLASKTQRTLDANGVPFTPSKADRNPTLTYRQIYLSGVFYRMYQTELAGRKDSKEILQRALTREILSDEFYQLSPAAQKRKMGNLLYQYKKDYQAWKNAFVTHENNTIDSTDTDRNV